MAVGKTIADLTAASTLTGAELMEVSQSSTSKKLALTNIAVPILTNTWTANQTYNDSVEIRIGTGADLVILHNGTNSSITNGTGALTIAGNTSLTLTGTTVTVNANSVVTIIEGSFTGTLTGMSGATTATVSYRVLANSAGTGKECMLWITANFTGTSNATTMTMTGLPAACQPVNAVLLPTLAYDSSTSVIAGASISAGTGTIAFSMGAGFLSTGFTAAGTKGLIGGWQIKYAL